MGTLRPLSRCAPTLLISCHPRSQPGVSLTILLTKCKCAAKRWIISRMFAPSSPSFLAFPSFTSQSANGLRHVCIAREGDCRPEIALGNQGPPEAGFGIFHKRFPGTKRLLAILAPVSTAENSGSLKALEDTTPAKTAL
jgi:hypothetical protein